MTEVKLNGRSPAATEFRSKRLIEAARELSLKGGYEAVQVRAVAKTAKVSLATLYRCYSSKDDILTAVVDREIRRFSKEIEERPSRHRAPAARAADAFIRAFRGMSQDRGFAHAIMTSYHVPVAFDEGQRRADAGDVLNAWPNDFLDIAARSAWGTDHTPTMAQYRALHMLEALWASSVIGWLNCTLTAAEVEKRLKIAATALIDD